jgi:DNA-binding response OmpR family regulator
MSQTILIVEDEADLARGLEINLRREGYEVLKAGTGDQGLQFALQEKPDLILLDVMLPGINGLDLCRLLRQRGFESPIIILTARGEEIDRVLGLELGADDYVAKPFGLRELIARIRVQLRRPKAPASPSVSSSVSRYCFGTVELDFEKCRATRAGKAVDLTVKEFEIMKLLVRNHGKNVTRDRLLNEVWGYESTPTTRTVDNHILRLRQKLENDPAAPEYILSVYGEGYKFVG